MTRLVLFELFVTNLLLFEHQKNKNKTQQQKLLVSWQFSGPYDVIKYGSGWRKDVVNQCLESDLRSVKFRACALASILIWAKGRGFEGIHREQKDAVQQLFDSKAVPWNGEGTDVCGTKSIALYTSLDKPRPFVFKLFSRQSFLILEI